MGDGRRQRRSRERWQQLIEEQAASGQTLKAFCAARGIGRSTFQRWRSRLQSGAAPVVASDTPTQALFTPLLAAETRAESEVATTERGWDIELDLGDGVCLRLRRGP